MIVNGCWSTGKFSWMLNLEINVIQQYFNFIK